MKRNWDKGNIDLLIFKNREELISINEKLKDISISKYAESDYFKRWKNHFLDIKHTNIYWYKELVKLKYKLYKTL